MERDSAFAAAKEETKLRTVLSRALQEQQQTHGLVVLQDDEPEVCS